MKKHGAAAAGLIILCCLLFFSGCAAERPVRRATAAMGSVLTADLYARGADADAVWKDAAAAVSELDGRISATKPDSELSRLNEAGAGTLSPATFGFLRDALALCGETGGALDVTLGAVTALWGFSTETPSLPAADRIAAALETVGAEKVRTDPAALTVALPDGARLDPGAVGKGAGTDAVLAVLRKNGCPAVVNFGGTVLLYGAPAGKTAWTVGLRDPRGGAEDWFAAAALPAKADEAYFVSTSGSYEKYFTENGKTYHHILDPVTGYPVETDLLGVTVISGGGLLSDALSTACFVTGPTRETRALLRQHGAEAAFVFADGGVLLTDGLRDRVSLAAEGYHFITDEKT